jgi:hypothetical protein
MAGVPSSLARLYFLLLPLATGCLLLLSAEAARLPLSLAPADAAADALLRLKAGINDSGGALGSWSPDTSPCGDGDGGGASWKGVMCNRDGVHGLQLEGMGLSGVLDLRALTSLPGPGLRTLSFMDNDFAGPLPDVKALSGLRALFLSGNKFSGVIPADAFAGMGSLKKVVLSNNDFTGPIPASLADAPRLLELQLNGNKFQGKIPDLKQDELTAVNLANNELEGEIPPSLKFTPPDMFAGEQHGFLVFYTMHACCSCNVHVQCSSHMILLFYNNACRQHQALRPTAWCQMRGPSAAVSVAVAITAAVTEDTASSLRQRRHHAIPTSSRHRGVHRRVVS